MAEEPPLTWQFLLSAYASGYFPMAQEKNSDEIHWFYPEKRGILPLDDFHVPASLAKFMRKNPFTITIDTVFPEVIRACADINAKRKDTWINSTIEKLYCELWENGFAHSVECWRSADRPALSDASCESQQARSGSNYELVGGLYGVALGGAFFGESMFSRTTNASRVALVHLVNLLKDAGYALLDTQFVNDHLKQFGVREIPRKEYLKRLADALRVKPKDCFSAA